MSSSPSVHLITPPPFVLCPLPPSSAAPRLPMSLTQAPGARPGSRALLRISLFGAPKRRPSKNERWAEHRSWMAAARWVYTTMNRTMVSSAGGEFDRRRGRGGTCGENVYASFWAAIECRKKNNERATGPWILMASAGCGDATTNQKSADMI
jgi:hypothetical protein